MVNSRLIMNFKRDELVKGLLDHQQGFRNMMPTSSHLILIKEIFKSQNGKIQAFLIYLFNNHNKNLNLLTKYQYNNLQSQFTMILALEITQVCGCLLKHAVK